MKVLLRIKKAPRYYIFKSQLSLFGGDTHPEKVTVRGKHKTYIATRHKKNAESPSPSKHGGTSTSDFPVEKIDMSKPLTRSGSAGGTVMNDAIKSSIQLSALHNIIMNESKKARLGGNKVSAIIKEFDRKRTDGWHKRDPDKATIKSIVAAAITRSSDWKFSRKDLSVANEIVDAMAAYLNKQDSSLRDKGLPSPPPGDTQEGLDEKELKSDKNLSRLDVLKNSLQKKEARLDDKFDSHFDDVRSANGQPLNDKRNGRSTQNRWDKQSDSIRTLKEGIEKTKRAINKEEMLISNIEDSKGKFPKVIEDMITGGELTQWRKHPNRFFVPGVEKARIIYIEKTGVVTYQGLSDITEKEQYNKFATAFNKVNKTLREINGQGK